MHVWRSYVSMQHICTSPHLTSPHLTSPHLTSPHLTSPHLTSPHLTSPHLISPHLTSPHLTSPHLTSPVQDSKQQSGTGAWKVSQRVAPLFETLADLDNAGKVMRRLFSVRWYREQLR